MSEEETDTEDDETPKKLLRRRFFWESNALKRIKQRLDEYYNISLTPLQRNSKILAQDSDLLVERPVPKGLPDAWVDAQYR